VERGTRGRITDTTSPTAVHIEIMNATLKRVVMS
jgi:hypothetical protein